jgi:hypothetical protein
LKTAQSRNFDESTLDIWDEKLIERGCELIFERLQLINELATPFTNEYRSVAPEGEVLMKYRSSLVENDILDPLSTKEVLLDSMASAIKKERKREIERGISLVGPHRDELLLLLDGELAKGYASHGESWSVALALKLAAYDLLEKDERLAAHLSSRNSGGSMPRFPTNRDQRRHSYRLKGYGPWLRCAEHTASPTKSAASSWRPRPPTNKHASRVY